MLTLLETSSMTEDFVIMRESVLPTRSTTLVPMTQFMGIRYLPLTICIPAILSNQDMV